MRTIKAMQQRVNPELLRRAIEARDPRAVADAMGVDSVFRRAFITEVAPALRRPFVSAAVLTERSMPQLNLRLDLTNPRALSWATNRSAQLVTEITRDVKLGIRRFVAQSFREGKTTKWLSTTLRRSEIIGLHSRQIDALGNFRDKLAARVDAGKITQAFADSQADRYQERLLRQRARTIARTETIRASSEGQNELWQQGLDDGTFDAEITRRVWIVTPDDRTCEICLSVAEMNPEGVPIGQPYQSIDGPVDQPPAHPNCRCAEGLEFVLPAEYQVAA